MIVGGQVNVASSLPAQQYNNSFVVVCSRRRRRRLPFGVKERERALTLQVERVETAAYCRAVLVSFNSTPESHHTTRPLF
jgi:hypothetical protein